MYDQLLIWAACSIGFFAFMRSGEITVPEGTYFNPEIHLTPKSVDNVHNPAVLKIRLKVSKTDQAKQGIDLFVGRTCNSLCPVVAMMKYLAVMRALYFGKQMGHHSTEGIWLGGTRQIGIAARRIELILLCRPLLPNWCCNCSSIQRYQRCHHTNARTLGK